MGGFVPESAHGRARRGRTGGRVRGRTGARVRARAARLAIVMGLVIGALAATAGTTAAYAPQQGIEHGRGPVPTPPSRGTGSSPGATPGTSPQTATVAQPPDPALGFDISYPQCDGAFPVDAAFSIVGVNGGKVFSVNPCLASQLAWGGGASAELYVNTGNPGPALSSFWPLGQTSPRTCDAANPDTADCAFDYGWNAARHSYETALAAYAELGLDASPSETTWWLDVETSNSWRDDTALNVAALQGGAAYLEEIAGVTRLGFYSTTAQWAEITGGTSAFADAPSWGAGAPDERAAREHCLVTPGFTGGELTIVQFIAQGVDANIRC